MHHFMQSPDHYKRDIRLLETYIEDSAMYLHKQTGRPIEECREFVKRTISEGGQSPLKIPRAMVLVRNKHQDREQREYRFDQYLDTVFQENEILAPTLAAYIHPDKKKSILADYIAGNLQKRKAAKKEMFVADMRGDKVTKANKDAEQNSLKIKNNSLSGAQSSPHTILWNKTAHCALTSMCRTATSYGNANNEKFLYGNRHYWEPDIVKTNIVSIINHTDLPRMENVMRIFKLQHPTVEQVMDMIRRCTEAYWRSRTQMTIIESLVKSLTPIERSAVMFTGDFYHLAQVNPDFVRQLLTELSTKAPIPLEGEEADHWMGMMDDGLTAFVSMLCAKELAGGTITDCDGKGTKLKDGRPHDYGIMAATAKSVVNILDIYEEFIKVFWVSDNIPASIFNLPAIIRRGAVTSDTDSTIFTVQYWTKWYVGKLDFSEQSMAVGSTMVYLASQLIRHILARFSSNMGVAKSDVNLLSMKNEYYFPVFVLTSRAKHYFAYISAREGNVYKEYDMEVKGVALRNSNVPPAIMKQAKALMANLMDTVIKGEKVSLTKVLRFVAKIEKGLRDSIESGQYSLLPKMQIKGAASYKDPTSSNYTHYAMWEEVFATKYGHAPEPPYVAIKVNTDTDNPTKLKNWLDSIEDPAITENLRTWLQKNGKKAVGTFLLPEPVLASTGVPKEIVKAVDIRSLIAQNMEAFYLILESLGYYSKNGNITKLVSDQEWLLADDWSLGELDI